MQQQHRKRGELIVTSIIALAPLYALYEIATKFREAGVHTGGGAKNAALFPRLISLALVFLLAVNVLQILRKKAGSDTPEEDSPAPGPHGTAADRRRVWLVFGLFLVYLIALEVVGYYVSTPLFIGTLMYMFGVRKPVFIGFFSVVVTVLMWLVFSQLLNMVLPVGRFGLYW